MPRTVLSFKYPLEPLLKQRRWEKDSSAAQEREARRVLNVHTEEARSAARVVSGVENALREALKAGVSIDPRRHESLSLYLGHAREVLQAKARQASKAGEMHEQTRHGLLRSIQAVRGLERHRENKQREHKRERQQFEQQKQDELWLTGSVGFRGRGYTTEGRQRRSSWR
jgi:flagellar biosynthesis chaperone FliJ